MSNPKRQRVRKKGTPPRRATPRRANGWIKACRVIWWILVVCLAALTITSAYGGMVNPERTTIFALISMAFPLLLIFDAIALIVSLFTVRWAFIPTVIALIASGGPLLDYFPLNIFRPNPSASEIQERGFSFMSYNVMNFDEYDNVFPSDSTNATLSYILRTNPDIACLQECEYFVPYKRTHLYSPQVDSIRQRYFYHAIAPNGNSIFSKYPVDSLPFQPHSKALRHHMSGYKATIHGEDVAILVVHLSSLGLSAEDKDLYSDLTQFKSVPPVKEFKDSLLSKISQAMRRRALLADELCEYIRLLAMPNVIVTGDFNDTPGCYSLRQLQKEGLRNAYSDAAIGPTITYYGDSFYFRIDHTLYRGALYPYRSERGDIRTSDHYPLLTDFIIQPK